MSKFLLGRECSNGHNLGPQGGGSTQTVHLDINIFVTLENV